MNAIVQKLGNWCVSRVQLPDLKPLDCSDKLPVVSGSPRDQSVAVGGETESEVVAVVQPRIRRIDPDLPGPVAIPVRARK